MKSRGVRNANHSKAKFYWSKTAYESEPLESTELEYLSELARLRVEMFSDKVKSEARQDYIEARHDEVVGILRGFHYLDISFPN